MDYGVLGFIYGFLSAGCFAAVYILRLLDRIDSIGGRDEALADTPADLRGGVR